jgi:hypothetical protein
MMAVVSPNDARETSPKSVESWLSKTSEKPLSGPQPCPERMKFSHVVIQLLSRHSMAHTNFWSQNPRPNKYAILEVRGQKAEEKESKEQCDV